MSDSCWIVQDVSCEATLGPLRYVEISRDAPQQLTAVVCDACDACDTSQPQSVGYQYARKSGWEFCLTVGTEVKFGVPAGPEWTVSIEGQVCYDTEETTQVQANLDCKGQTMTSLRILETKVRSTATMDATYDKVGTFSKATHFGANCPTFEPDNAVRTESVRCGVAPRSAEVVSHEYVFDFDDVRCPIPPGSCDERQRTVFIELEGGGDSGRYEIDRMIPCFYTY